MTNRTRMTNEDEMPTQEINNANKGNEKKGTNASRSIKTETKGQQEGSPTRGLQICQHVRDEHHNE